VPKGIPQPTVYTRYADVCSDPDVEIVYIATPHALHKENCLEAIAHGKHVLCEKPFAVNLRDAEEIFAAARAKGVFAMEAVWTRFNPLFKELISKLHSGALIGDVQRVFCDFSLPMSINTLPPDSRLRRLDLGAGALLDIGLYTVMWGALALDQGIGERALDPEVVSSSIVQEGIDVANSVILSYPQTGRQAILTCSLSIKTRAEFCRIEGTEGTVTVSGVATSSPSSYTVTLNKSPDSPQRVDLQKVGMGLYYEADAVALDIASARTQNEDVMPWAETVRLLKILDGIRRTAGVQYPQDRQG
jgi:predicted dehydrogenase